MNVSPHEAGFVEDPTGEERTRIRLSFSYETSYPPYTSLVIAREWNDRGNLLVANGD